MFRSWNAAPRAVVGVLKPEKEERVSGKEVIINQIKFGCESDVGHTPG